jgi:hypothetical protein
MLFGFAWTSSIYLHDRPKCSSFRHLPFISRAETVENSAKSFDCHGMLESPFSIKGASPPIQ